MSASRKTYRYRVIVNGHIESLESRQAAYTLAERVAPSGTDPERLVTRQVWDPDVCNWVSCKFQ